MAIDFYKLGRKTGATTPKGQQSGFQSLVGSAIKPIEDMLKASQEKTAALTASMTAGVPIDKVPEELRGQVTNFLTENKKSYTDATKVIASGVNPQSEQYKNAVETINNVNGRFENLSANLENIALERQKYLDDPSYSPNTSRSDATTMSDLANGSLYGKMSLNEDGSWNYTDAKGESKAFRDFKVNKQGYLGQQGFIAMTEHLDKNALDINGNVKKWEGGLENYYGLQLNQLFNKLGPKGSQDYVMADDEFLQTRYDDKKLDGTKGSFEDYKDALTQGSKEEVVEEYKQYNLNLLREQHSGAVAKTSSTTDVDKNKSGKYNGYKQQYPVTFNNEKVHHETMAQRRNELDNLNNFSGSHGAYEWDKKQKKYTNTLDDNKVMSVRDVAELEGLVKPGESLDNFGDSNFFRNKSNNENLKQGKATIEMLETDGDDATSGVLNNHFSLDKRSPYRFVPFSTQWKYEGYDPETNDNFGSNDVMLINPNPPYQPLEDPATGEIYKFKTGEEATPEDLQKINKLLKDSIKKQTPVNEEFAN